MIVIIIIIVILIITMIMMFGSLSPKGGANKHGCKRLNCQARLDGDNCFSTNWLAGPLGAYSHGFRG